ncbi:MAG: SDR family oxidoreductase [Pseudonocardiales bacterium]|nr:SDR family oxidoreductase [Pseudonocardiales bacterium]
MSQQDQTRRPVALITGAASGIGAACAHMIMMQSGAELVMMDRDGDGLTAVVATLPQPQDVLTITMDVTDEAAWATATVKIKDRFGRLDWVVASAGVTFGAAITETRLEDWRRVLTINLDGVFLTLRATLPVIRAGGQGGAVVVVSSAAAVKAEPGVGAYGASKAGALQLAKIAAKEGAPDRIRVNVLLPGGVETPMWRTLPMFAQLVHEHGNEQAAFDALARLATPLERYSTAEEMATLVLFLLRDAPTVTGAALVADGGYTL